MYLSRTVRALVGERDREISRLRQENRELLDRLMYAVEKPWTPSPADVRVPVTVPVDSPQFIDVDEEP